MGYENVPFGSLAALAADELIEFDKALDATNLYLDTAAIAGRNGYRNALAAVVGSGLVQSLGRMRVSPTFARTIATIGGTVYAVTDPTTEQLSNGSVQNVATVFGSTANISTAQLGKYLYLASDDPTVSWRRARQSGSSISLDNFTTIPKGVSPSYSVAAPALVKYTSLAAPTLSASVTSSTISTDVLQFSRSGSHCQAGDTVEFNFGADQNWASYNWLQVFVSPMTQSAGGGHLKVSLATAAGTYEDVGEVYDVPGGGSPNVAWFPLNLLTSGTRAAARRIRFQVTSSDGIFLVFGHLAVPTALGPGLQQYFFTYYNSSTKQESAPTDTLSVNVGAVNLSGTNYHNAYRNYDANVDAGQASVDPAAVGSDRNFNKNAGLAFPGTSDYSGFVSFSGTIPTGDQYPNADTIRGWKLTTTGYRLFNSAAIIAAQTTWTLADNAGTATLAAQLYVAQGLPPACNAMAARAARIVCGGAPSTPNRLFISSYVPINTELEGTTSDPFPQFPAIPVVDTDGYSFDISATAAEQIVSLVNGDALYILTNEATYSMYDLGLSGLIQPTPSHIFERGAIGRRAAIWAEERLFFVAHDGIYFCQNRANVQELSAPIRRLFLSWFQPDSTVVLGYQDRKLYAVRGSLVLRYDFVTQSWTRHTLSNSMAAMTYWRTDADATQRLWMLDTSGNLLRWQPGISATDTNRATTDAGTAIPAWTYSTGFDLKTTLQPGSGYGEAKTRIKYLFCDSSGSVTVSCIKDANALTAGTNGPKAVNFTAGQHGLEVAPLPLGFMWRVTLTAANGVSVRRLLLDRGVVQANGG